MINFNKKQHQAFKNAFIIISSKDVISLTIHESQPT